MNQKEEKEKKGERGESVFVDLGRGGEGEGRYVTSPLGLKEERSVQKTVGLVLQCKGKGGKKVNSVLYHITEKRGKKRKTHREGVWWMVWRRGKKEIASLFQERAKETPPGVEASLGEKKGV